MRQDAGARFGQGAQGRQEKALLGVQELQHKYHGSRRIIRETKSEPDVVTEEEKNAEQDNEELQ